MKIINTLKVHTRTLFLTGLCVAQLSLTHSVLAASCPLPSSADTLGIPSPATFSVAFNNGFAGFPNGGSYFLATLSPSGTYPGGTYKAWCSDAAADISIGVTYSGTIIDSQFTSCPNATHDSCVPPVIYMPDGTFTPSPCVWNEINYLINHKIGNADSVQAAIWDLISPPDASALGTTPNWNAADRTAMVLAAQANQGFVPGPGQVRAAILYVQDSVQVVFIEVQIPGCDCSISFLSPLFVTNCPGTSIADIIATEQCGTTPATPATVIVTGTVTNGTCPQIVTRTNTATDDCGKTWTFVQTITIPCKPVCSLVGSVLQAIVGTGGLHATVLDAGPGATYLWNISNGTITNGLGTTNITFVAGPDPSLPVSISVTITTAAGCVSACTLSIPLIPRCDCVITFISPKCLTNCAGDTIPPVVAYQKCANVASSNLVTVTCIGAKTNGTCPKIITRTNAAVSTCGDRFTFVQTITVNCRGTICGHIFADCDGNGDLTAGDVGLGKVIVSLTLSNKVICSIMTDSNGGYCFTNLAGGCYVVAVTPPTGYTQTAASSTYHWRDSYGRDCWNENDGYIHCVSSGTECWWDKYSTCHWKDSYNRDCWKDNWGGYHCQPCSYTSCNAQTNNNKISVCIDNCDSESDVDFSYTGTKSSLSVCVSGPSYVKCGQSYTYTCNVTNTGNVCFQGGTVCHTIGNCNWGSWSYGCNTFNTTCPPLAPGQHCTITQRCYFNSWNCGTVTCQSTVNQAEQWLRRQLLQRSIFVLFSMRLVTK